MKDILKEKIQSFPHNPGVYLFRDTHSGVVYVGKAKDLKKRVVSYLRDDIPPKTRLMMDRARDVSFIVTATEKDALLLENNLIKEHHPRYNINLRDDKDYPCLRLTVNEEFPHIEVVRRPRKDGALYFGPFSSAKAVRQTLKLMQRLFPLRKCKGRVGESKRPCLNYQLGRCLGPCWGKVTRKEYDRVVQEAIYFLQGRRKELERILKQEMEAAAESLDFELAARIRDRLKAVSNTLERQHIIYRSITDADVVGIYGNEQAIDVAVLSLRGGSVIGSRSFVLDPQVVQGDGLAAEFLKRFYHHNQFIPPEIVIPENISDRELLEEWLSEERGGRVRLTAPQRGEKRSLLAMARKNAETFQKTRLSKEHQTAEVLETIRGALHLKNVPRSIECYDISTTQGKQNVGSRVRFFMGEPDKMGYRHYRVEGKGYPDDYAMMREVIERRFARAEEDPLPDLLMVDGGKGQLNIALDVAREFNLELDMAGLAKEEFDKIYIPGRKNPVVFRPDNKALHLLQRIRDESHRFAVQYHRKLRTRAGLDTEINSLPGVGAARGKALLTHFGSVERIRAAGVEEIASVPGINRNLAGTIFNALHRADEDGHSLP